MCFISHNLNQLPQPLQNIDPGHCFMSDLKEVDLNLKKTAHRHSTSFQDQPNPKDVQPNKIRRAPHLKPTTV